MTSQYNLMAIDPGDKGAIAMLNGKHIKIVDMPVVRETRTRLSLDMPALVGLIESSGVKKILLEKIQTMPKGANANFKRGGYQYAIRAICCALKLQLVEIPPKEWQKHFGIKSTKKDDTKGQSYTVASGLFPDLELKTPRGTIKDGRCDAVLILEYGRRRK